MEHAVETNRVSAESRGLSLQFERNASPVQAWCDFNRITQVVNNLLSNAFKFSDPQGAVVVDVAQTGGWVRTSVSNRGAGIPDEFKERIFLPFSQVHSGPAQDGSGLGLSICKTIVEDHKGFIGFDASPDGPTVFYFLLPVSTAGAQASSGHSPL